MSFKGFLRTLSSIFGSLLITFGILIIFFGLVGINFSNQLENFDDILKVSLMNFVENNREEIREYFSDQMSEELPQNKAQVEPICQQWHLLGDEQKEIITEEFCELLPSMTEKEMLNYFVDKVIDTNLDQLGQKTLPFDSKQEIENQIKEIRNVIGNLSYIFMLGIIIYLIGCFLTFVSIKFNLLRGTYRILLKTSINLLTVGIIFVFMNLLKAENIMNLIKGSMSFVPEMSESTIPEIFLKLFSEIALKFIQLSTYPLIYVAFGVSVPFIIITIIFLVIRSKKKNKKEKTNKNIQDNSQKEES